MASFGYLQRRGEGHGRTGGGAWDKRGRGIVGKREGHGKNRGRTWVGYERRGSMRGCVVGGV